MDKGQFPRSIPNYEGPGAFAHCVRTRKAVTTGDDEGNISFLPSWRASRSRSRSAAKMVLSVCHPVSSLRQGQKEKSISQCVLFSSLHLLRMRAAFLLLMMLWSRTASWTVRRRNNVGSPGRLSRMALSMARNRGLEVRREGATPTGESLVLSLVFRFTFFWFPSEVVPFFVSTC
jgi:hypothetical protein